MAEQREQQGQHASARRHLLDGLAELHEDVKLMLAIAAAEPVLHVIDPARDIVESYQSS